MKHSEWVKGMAESASRNLGYGYQPFFEMAIRSGTSLVENHYEGVVIEGSESLDDVLLRIGYKVINDTYNGTTYISARTRIVINENEKARGIHILTSDKGVLDFLEEIIDAWLAPMPEQPAPPPTVYSFGVTNSGYTVRDIGAVKGGLIRTNYPATILAQFDRVTEQLRAEIPSGRLVLMEGEPGTGKTHLVRALIVEMAQDCKCILVPPNVMADLAGPAFLDALMDARGQRIVLILEDADDCLIAREKNAAAKASLASLLNMSDGILGSALDLCIVATTNQKFDNLDRAVLRPGRLLQRMSVGALSPDEASACFAALTGRTRAYDAPTTLAQVYEHTAEGA